MKRLKFKGKEIEKSKFKSLNFKSLNEEYDGFVDVDTGCPHGEGTLTVRNKDKTLWQIEEGIWQNGFLTEGIFVKNVYLAKVKNFITEQKKT